MSKAPGINDLPPWFSELRRKDQEIRQLRTAAKAVCRFDWSGNDDDAVAAIEALRHVLNGDA